MSESSYVPTGGRGLVWQHVRGSNRSVTVTAPSKMSPTYTVPPEQGQRGFQRGTLPFGRARSGGCAVPFILGCEPKGHAELGKVMNLLSRARKQAVF
jgi:hypothetical protein